MVSLTMREILINMILFNLLPAGLAIVFTDWKRLDYKSFAANFLAGWTIMFIILIVACMAMFIAGVPDVPLIK